MSAERPSDWQIWVQNNPQVVEFRTVNSLEHQAPLDPYTPLDQEKLVKLGFCERTPGLGLSAGARWERVGQPGQPALWLVAQADGRWRLIERKYCRFVGLALVTWVEELCDWLVDRCGATATQAAPRTEPPTQERQRFLL